MTKKGHKTMEASLNAEEFKKHNPLFFFLFHSLILKSSETWPWSRPCCFIFKLRYVSFWSQTGQSRAFKWAPCAQTWKLPTWTTSSRQYRGERVIELTVGLAHHIVILMPLNSKERFRGQRGRQHLRRESRIICDDHVMSLSPSG